VKVRTAFDSRQGPVLGCYEHGDEALSYIKSENLLST
jgi:hypothetical protein